MKVMPEIEGGHESAACLAVLAGNRCRIACAGHRPSGREGARVAQDSRARPTASQIAPVRHRRAAIA